MPRNTKNTESVGEQQQQQPRPLWPTEFALNAGATSSLPAIQIIGASETGKSTFIASIAPAVPGQPSRTLVIDTENSYTTLEHQIKFDRFDARAAAQALFAKNAGKGERERKTLPQCLFEVVMERLDALEPGKYEVLAIDTFSDIYLGTMDYLRDHMEIFNPRHGYRGKEGQMYGQGDVRLFWKNKIAELSNKVQTVVFATHPKDEYAGEKRTGKQVERGVDLTEILSLKLWLFSPKHKDPQGRNPDEKGFAGGYWAYVQKSRLTYVSFDDDGEMSVTPMLPKVLRSENGRSYAAIIRGYMKSPEPDYGDLNVVVGDPTMEAETEAERQKREIELAEARKAQELHSAKTAMVKRLVDQGVFERQIDVSNVVLAKGELFALAQDIATLPKLEAELRKFAAERMLEDEPADEAVNV